MNLTSIEFSEEILKIKMKLKSNDWHNGILLFDELIVLSEYNDDIYKMLSEWFNKKCGTITLRELCDNLKTWFFKNVKESELEFFNAVDSIDTAQ